MADTSQDWKVGQKVNIGTLKGLEVTAITQEGSLQKFTLIHPDTRKEYSFVPGGLRKTYEPPPPAAPAADPLIASRALDKARSILQRRCRRASDAPVRAELQEVIALLSHAGVGGQSMGVDTPAKSTEVSPATLSPAAL